LVWRAMDGHPGILLVFEKTELILKKCAASSIGSLERHTNPRPKRENAVPQNITHDNLRFLTPAAPLANLAMGYLEAMLARERNRATDLVMAALDGGAPIRDIYLQVLQPVQYEIGWLWQSGKITVGHEHYCTNATQLVMSLLYPRLFTGEVGAKRILATCVEGELHELGLRMLSDFFEMDGWNTDYLGANTPQDAVVSALEEKQADVLAIGATMHYHLEEVEKLIDAIRRSDQAKAVKILVGGYTFSAVDNLWKQVGADGTARDADQAITLANQLTEKG